ncbi:MAG: hypothetical protein HWD84_09920 [Flavobacteriaceae bacterium]|nr:hypothetical protein [Flavobacteriaceae bacterium]
MDEKLVKSLDTILVHASRHCRQFRLADHEFSKIAKNDLRSLASSLLDYFEEEMERLQAKERAK